MSDIDNIDALNARDKAKYKPLTPEQRAKKQERFLKALGEHGVVKAACKYAGISRQTYKNWRDHDEAFQSQLPDVYEERNDTLEYAAYEQAVIGVFEPLVSMGQPVYELIPVLDKNGDPVLDRKGKPKTERKMLTRRVLAPSLLQTLLKAHLPEKYKDRSSVDLHANVSTPADRNQMLATMNEEELDQLETLLHAAQERVQHGG
jgi:hypothetical protein